MANFVESAWVLVICLVLESNCATTAKYVSYNSSDLSYLSNGIQFPVPSINKSDPIIRELVNEALPYMQWISQLYNHYNWEKRLEILENPKCRAHLSTYLSHLKNNTLWAVKMDDASGRYSSQFFFGNDYWLGSSTLCKELEIWEANADVPPFPVHFYVAKIRININEALTPVTRQLNLGQCLPSSCTVSDVRRLLVQERSQGTSLSVVGVRAVPGDYSILLDYKFHIIGGIGLFVFVIVIVATFMEYYSNECHRDETDIEMTNNNNIYSNNNNSNGGGVENAKSKQNYDHSNCTTKVEQITKVVLCFSALKNGKKILNMSSLSNESIKCLHGLRFLSIAWIILVHTYLQIFAIADNKSLRVVTERLFLYQTISNATFSVDTFFFISGLLVTIGYLRREMNKIPKTSDGSSESFKSSVTKYFILIFYRYVRLTPAYLFVLGVNELTMRYLHSNSVFTPAIIDHITCTKYWWRNALYINNFFPQSEFCMLWSWYMSNDTQFFAVTLILLTIAIRNETSFRCVIGAIIVFMISSWATTFTIAMKYKYVARIEEPFALFDELYDKPWLRVGPYLVGIITGYILLKLNGKLVLPKTIIAPCWILSLACLTSLVYGLGRKGLVIPTSAFYVALGHTAWGVSLAWITVACSTGYGGPIGAFLSFKGLLPFSRLTYCAYLVHPMIMCITSFQLDGPIHLHQGIALVIFFGNVVVSFFMAFAISLGFEAPFVRLLKLI